MGRMGATYSVIVNGSEDEACAKARLAEICAARNLVPLWGGRAIKSLGTGKWQVAAQDPEDYREQRHDGRECTMPNDA